MFGRSSAFNVQDTPRPPAEAKLEALYREQQHARERPPAPAPPMSVPARQPTSSRHASRQPIDAEDPRSPLQGGPPRDSPWSGFGSLWDVAASALERLSSSSLHVEEPVEEERRAEEEPSASIKTDELGLALAEGAAADVPKLGPTRTARLQVKVDALMAQLNHFVAALNRANVPGGGKSAVPGVGKSAGGGRDSRDSRNRRDCSGSSGSSGISISGNERQRLAQMLPPLEDAQPRILSILRGGTIADRELIVQLVELYQGIDEARRRYWKLQGWHAPDPSPPAVHSFAEYAPETEAIKAAAAAKAKAAVAKVESAAEIEAELKRFKAELKAQKRAGNRTGDVGMPATSSVASRASRASSLDPGAARISSISSVSGTGSGAIKAPTRSSETTRPPAIRTPEEAEAAAASATGDYLGDYLGDMDDEERRLDEEERRLDEEEEEERAAAKLRAMVAHRSHWTSPFEALRGTQGGRHRHSAHRRSPWRSPSHFGTSPSLKAIARSTSALTMALGGQLQEQLASPSRFLRHQMEMHREALKEHSRHREVRREHSRQEREHSQKERERSRQREYSTWVLPTHVDHKPWFCMLSTLACTIVFIFEVRGVPRIAYDGLGWPLMAYDGLGWPLMASDGLPHQVRENGWTVAPFVCPEASATGLPTYADGTPCEPNWMLGPPIRVLNRMGAKNDEAIFGWGVGRGEWWRLFTSSWLHSGLFHLLLNLLGILSLGVGFERAFGFVQTALLYIVSGLLGTVCSTVFLPGVISVGASGSMFGLLGAYWADVLFNYCSRGTLRHAGVGGLLFATVPNLVIGLTP